MSKSKFIPHIILGKTNIALFCVVMMVVGFLFSRAVLSISMIAFGLNAIWNVNPKTWFKNKYWLAGLLWVGVYGLSWFWTADKANWHERFDVKLPILLLPLAFGLLPAFTLKQQKIFTIAVGTLLIINVSYSLYFFLLTPADYVYEYSVSHVLPTLALGDHIRSSLFIALFIIWTLYFWRYLHNRWLKSFVGFMIVLFIIYLHILAARTGLLALYAFVGLYGIFLGVSKSRLLGITIILFLFLFAAFAYKYSPTLRNRIGYFKYTIIEYKRVGLKGYYSDMGRLISYDIGLRKIKEHPIYGVGAGDVFREMDAGYNTWYPDVAPDKRLMPHNQFMVVALGCGLPALILFIAWLFTALTGIKRSRQGFFLFAFWAVLLIPLMVEPMLEVQFGVFVYLFFLLWHRHVAVQQPET